jgi:uncharacterized RDD family membrane protein YckC
MTPTQTAPGAGDQWFFEKDGQQNGPVPAAAIQQMLAAGQLFPTNLVWREGLPNWMPAGQAFGGIAAVPGAVGYYAYAPEARPPYAGFWLRFVAYLIDYALTYAVGFVVGFGIGFAIAAAAGPNGNANNVQLVVTLVSGLVGMIISWLYWALMESSEKQATLGKMALGLKVTDLAGNRISFGRASGRFFAKILSGLLLCIGYIMVAFTDKKQGLHDQIASTLVVKKA